jgi:hypothetical protein
MKKRNGFVSNSSSSSFIVAFSKTPESVDELQKMLFDDKLEYPYPYPDLIDSMDDKYKPPLSWPTKDIAHDVWNSLHHKQPLTNHQVLDEIISGYFEGYPEHQYDDQGSYQMISDARFDGRIPFSDEDEKQYPDWYIRYSDTVHYEWHEHDKAVEKAAGQLLAKYQDIFDQSDVYMFEYSDNDGALGCAMEHGDLFEQLPHITISKH